MRNAKAVHFRDAVFKDNVIAAIAKNPRIEALGFSNVVVTSISDKPHALPCSALPRGYHGNMKSCSYSEIVCVE